MAAVPVYVDVREPPNKNVEVGEEKQLSDWQLKLSDRPKLWKIFIVMEMEKRASLRLLSSVSKETKDLLANQMDTPGNNTFSKLKGLQMVLFDVVDRLNKTLFHSDEGFQSTLIGQVSLLNSDRQFHLSAKWDTVL